MIRNTAAALAAVLLLATAASSAASADPTVIRLENGLEAILVENHGAPMITATLVVRAGTDDETARISGAAHLMEHLLFNGTERRTQKQLYDEADLYGVYNNAATRRFYTVYFVLAGWDRIAEAMDIQEDMVFHSVFPPEKFEKEKGIVLEEIGKDEQDPAYLADRLIRSVLFDGTPYARPVLGTRRSVREMSREGVVDFWRASTVPGNAVLLVAGDFETDTMIETVREIYGRRGAAPSLAPREEEPPPLVLGGRTKIFHSQREKGTLAVAFGAPGHDDPDFPLFHALARFASRRLERELAGGSEPVLSSVAVSYEARAGWGRLIVTADLPPGGDPLAAEGAIAAALERFAGTPPSLDEVERFRVSEKTAAIYDAEKLHHYGLLLAESLARGGWETVEALRAAADRLDPETILDGFARLVDAERRLAAAVLPGEPDFAQEDLAVLVPGETALAERERIGGAQAEYALLRKPARRDSGERGARSETADTTLANGLRIRVLSDDDSEVFALHLLAKNRSAQEPEGRAGIADLLHRILLRGTLHAGEETQAAALERIGAEVKTHDWSFIPFDDYQTVPDYSYVRFTTIDEFAPRGTALFADMVLRPAIDPKSVEAVREEAAGLARRRVSRHSELSRLLLARALYGDGPLARDPEGNTASLAAATAEEIRAFHRLYFAPDNLILTAVTSRPARETLLRLARHFDAPGPAVRRLPPPAPPEPTRENARVEEELGGTQGYLRIGYVIRVPGEDREALRAAVSILSDRIAFDLREARGLAYSVGAGVVFRGERATVAASIGAAPENLAEAEEGIREHLDRMGTDPSIGSAELERTVNAVIGRANMRLLTRPSRAYRTGLALFLGDGEPSGEELRALTPEIVEEAARRYLRSSPSATVIVR